MNGDQGKRREVGWIEDESGLNVVIVTSRNPSLTLRVEARLHELRASSFTLFLY